MGTCDRGLKEVWRTGAVELQDYAAWHAHRPALRGYGSAAAPSFLSSMEALRGELPSGSPPRGRRDGAVCQGASRRS